MKIEDSVTERAKKLKSDIDKKIIQIDLLEKERKDPTNPHASSMDTWKLDEQISNLCKEYDGLVVERRYLIYENPCNIIYVIV